MLNYKSPGIQRYIFERICQIHDEILVKDPEYKELGEVPSELFNRLWDKLCPEDQDLLDDYSSESMQQLNRQDEILYTRGLMDGIVLCRWFEKIERASDIKV